MKAITVCKQALLWPVFLSLCACTASINTINNSNINGLKSIQRAYQQAVSAAHNDNEVSWNNGRFGNIIVNVNGEPNLGLCYHWQKLVFKGIQPALSTTGWKATGIAINEGSFFEHHAVLVYDPLRTKFTDILKKPDKTDSYVLDPWSSGEPRIYTVENWLKLPVTIKVKPRLTKIDLQPTKITNEPSE